jgi:predicted ATP-grasp superfamily ATP-dependent carboligase
MIDGPTAIVVGGLAPGLAVARSLGRRGVRVLVATHSPDEPAASSRYVSGVLLTPNPAVDQDSFVAALIAGAPAGERPIIVPPDDAVGAVARNLDRLADRFTEAAPSWPVAEWFIDKRKTALLAEKVGVRAPRFSVPTDFDQAVRVSEDVV